MNAGDAIAFSRLTLHGSGPNTTKAARVAYAVRFHRNHVTATPKGQPDTSPYLLRGTRGPMTSPVDQLSQPGPSMATDTDCQGTGNKEHGARNRK